MEFSLIDMSGIGESLLTSVPDVYVLLLCHTQISHRAVYKWTTNAQTYYSVRC